MRRGPSSAEVRRFPVAVRREEVIHFLGYPEGKSLPLRFEPILAETIAEARALAEPRGALARFSVEEARAVGLEPIEASGLILGLVTVGRGIERAASAWAVRGEATRALFLDAAGSAAVEEAADRLSALVLTAETAGTSVVSAGAGDSPPADAVPVSCRVSPGYGNWHLASQQALFDRLPHRELGIELLTSLLMIPRKSVSFALWLDAAERPLAGLAGCARCWLPNCRYRRAPAAEGPA